MARSSKMTWLIALAMIFTGVATASVEAEPRLVVEITAEKLVVVADDDGGERVTRTTPEVLLPGEEVIYTLTYRNSHADRADEIAITNPIDPSLRYEYGTATGDDTTVVFSIDGGATFAAAEQLEVVDAEGNRRPAGPDEYTHIRWIRVRPLESGGEGRVTFSARVR